jgi:hypothetical protein
VVKKYRTLRIVRSLYRVAAIAVFLLSIAIGGLVAVAPILNLDYTTGQMTAGPPDIARGIGVLIGGVLIALSLFAVSEMILLLLDIEENTRETAQLAQQQTLYLERIIEQKMEGQAQDSSLSPE